MPIDALVDIAESYLSKEDVMCLKAAYEFAAKAHEGQTRKSGEPYIHHPVEVAIILAELKMDLTTLIAALLHDVVEDTSVTLEEVEEKFGPAVGKLVDGVTKLRKRMKFKSNQEHQAENHRKCLWPWPKTFA
jgi:guanosine-3',5'-bis(diphosphate) 3'-pyrophosphohydrolase